jgi:hypothetical protein
MYRVMISTLIATSYFSAKKHPQFGDPHLEGVESTGFVKNNTISYIGKWYDSVKALGVHGRIFCDNLEDDFVKEYTTDKIEFVKVSPSDYSNNDWRFFCYLDYFKDVECETLFFTDGSDVTVVKDPAELLVRDETFFLCKDTMKLDSFAYGPIRRPRIYVDMHEQFGWDDQFRFRLNHHTWDLINMGVIGGRYIDIMDFLGKFVDVRTKLGNPGFNADIWVGQYVFRSLLADKELLVGDPVTSEFKEYQTDRKDVFFIHK